MGLPTRPALNISTIDSQIGSRWQAEFVIGISEKNPQGIYREGDGSETFASRGEANAAARERGVQLIETLVPKFERAET